MYRECLSFDDVLLVPRYSTLSSRSQSNVSYIGFSLPIVMSPMDNITTHEMIKLFIEKNLMATVHRYFMTPKEQLDYVDPMYRPYVWFAVGSIKKSKDWIDYLYRNGVSKFIIDMAHGDCELSVKTVEYIKEIDYMNKVMAGNVVTRSGFDRLQVAGADAIRVGIGGGCFTPDMPVYTSTGNINISKIKIGDKVFTHTGKLKTVINLISYDVKNCEMYKINDYIECTSNHEFYVIHKNDVNKNPMWLSANELTNDYMLINKVNNDYIHIKNIELFKYSGKIYDLTVEDDHSYNINKIVVHNSICSTRTSCGFGVPQLTAISDCAEVKLPNVLLISDGGIKHPGDISKAIAAGADLCMLGKVLAATDLAAGQCYDKDKFVCSPYIQTPYNIHDNVIVNLYKKTDNCIINPSVKYKEYHGMASRDARKGVLQYASVEGVSGLIPFFGTTEQLLIDLKLNLQASMSYAGATDWDEFKRHVKIIKISNSAIIESSTHVEGFQ